MIQLLGWIFLICLFSKASTDTTLEIGSEISLETPSTTINPFEHRDKSSTDIPSTISAENFTSNDADSSSITDTMTEMSEFSFVAENISTPEKPKSMTLKRNVPEPAYMGEMTITYQNTTPNLRKSTEETQDENSTVSSLDNLYYRMPTTTDYSISSEMNGDSPDLAIEGGLTSSTPSMELITENGKMSHLGNATVIKDSVTSTILDDGTDTTMNQANGDGELESEESIAKLLQDSSAVKDSKNKETHPDMMKEMIFDNYKFDLEIQNQEEDNKQAESIQTMETTIILPEISTPKHDEISFIFTKNEEKNESVLKKPMEPTETPNDKIASFTDQETARFQDYIAESMSVDATESNTNSTRNPKKIQGEEGRYPEGRIRPSHPDPGYANRPEIDLVRPYRPDTPIHQYPYYRPTPDYRTPIIREDKDYTRPPRPDPEYQRVSFRPSYSYSKTSQEVTSSPKPPSQYSTSPKPYRPSSIKRPYHPQTSFGRPYRPDYHRPASKPNDEYSVTKASEIKGGSSQEEVSESRADYDYTRQSEGVSSYTKTYQSDARPSPIKTDSAKPYRPTYGTEISMHSKSTSPADSFNENRHSVKVPSPDMDTSRPSSSYPRPGFGNNYQGSDTSVKPFSVGTVTSAKNLTRVEFIKADCFDNHMKVTMRFNGTFNGLVYSSGYAQDSSCSYVNGSGRNHYEFYIRLNRCGTLGQQEVAEQRLRSLSTRRRQERAQYLVNTVTVQYNPVIEEDIDEHFRVTCEYGYDFWKTVTFPVVSVESSAVKIRTGSPVVFTLPPPQCNMEIRSGFGPSGTRVAGPVNVGDPLTLVIHMKSESTGFDILVSNCYAHNGAQKRLQLIDANGCVVQDKLVSPFRGVSSPDRSQQVTLYSYLKAFRFTGSPALYIECDVHMCHGSCPPQRCYWRHLYKRSVNEMTTEATTTPDNLISESISLFQALEVRHEEVDSPNLLALRNSNGIDTDDVVCLRTAGFAALLGCLLLLLVLATFAAVCMCHRMRKMKRFVEASDTKHFVEFDGHVPMK